jgi:coenzyme F420 hydrogenase subunit delta
MADLPDYLTKEIVVLGCGNSLFGDDGFGPSVANFITHNYDVPERAMVLDVGTSVRDLLFTMLLSEKKPRSLIVVDAVDRGRTAGEVFEISVDDIPERKTDDFSMHQVPTSNMLKELKDLGGMGVTVIACQVQKIPEEVSPGLSSPVADAVPKASKIIYEKFISRRGEG